MSKVESVTTEASTNWHTESLRYRTSSGILVRSKNELLATFIFDKFEISYVYEEALFINGIVVYTDFKLISPDGSQSLLIEIFGMMDDPEYRASCAKKVYNYIVAGFTPGVDVLFLYCNGDGSIDLKELERVLMEWAYPTVA